MQILNTLHRVYTTPKQLDAQVEFYEKQYGKDYYIKFYYPELNLHLVQIENILILSADDLTWKKIPNVRQTALSFLVDSIQNAYQTIKDLTDIEIISAVKQVPTGWNLSIRNIFGEIIEYVQHNSAKIKHFKKQ